MGLNPQKTHYGHKGHIHRHKEQGQGITETEAPPGKGNSQEAQIGNGVKHHNRYRSQGQGPDSGKKQEQGEGQHSHGNGDHEKVIVKPGGKIRAENTAVVPSEGLVYEVLPVVFPLGYDMNIRAQGGTDFIIRKGANP